MQPTGNRRIAVIMAGGSGERFWPLSRRTRPKQLLKLADPHLNLLEQSVARIEKLIPREAIYIATARHLRDAICSERIGVPNRNILAEPCKRNTAGCLAYAAAHLSARFENPAHSTMAILTADHLIRDERGFRNAVEAALATAEREEALVVIGIPPTRPETGYGYIETQEGAAPVWTSPDGAEVLAAAGFREKPDRETALQFVQSGRFFWNSGMFFWRLNVFLNELEQASPRHADMVARMTDALRAGQNEEADRVFESIEDVSIDYALMEKARHVRVVRAGFGWDDIGAWDALDRTYEPDENGNVAVGQPVVVESRDCIIYNDPGPARMAVAVAGVEGLAVIVCADGVLVIPKDRAQDVRKVVAELKKRGFSQL